MLNKVLLIGRLGQDPKITIMENGDKVANFSIATSERYRDKDGNRKERTEWHRISVFEPIVNSVEQYLSKGSKVHLEGSLRTDKYNQAGIDMWSTRIVAKSIIFLDSKSTGTTQNNEQVPVENYEQDYINLGNKNPDDMPF